MAYAYDASLIERIMPRVKQFEATSGRRITPAMLDALIKGQLDAEVGKAQQSRALDLQERGIANAEQATKDAKSAAKVKGVTDIASTAGMGYLAYKSVTKPSAMSELIAYQKGLTTPGGSAAISATAPSAVPAFTAAGEDALLTGGAATTQGAQVALAGGVPGVGAQTALAGDVAVESLAAYDASLAAGAAEGVGTAGAGGAGVLSTVAPYATPAAIALSGRPVGKLISKTLGTHEKTTTDITEAAAYAGAGFMVAGPVGAVVGGILGAVKGIADSVVCGELLRQGEITERDRTKCVVFRFRYISDDTFDAYLKWAKPHVEAMRKGGWRNVVRLPFAHAFVGYMIAIQDKRRPTVFERAVWNHAWRRCEKIAQRSEQFVVEVA